MDVVAKCRVTSDYEKKDPSELSLKTGDVVEVLRKGKYIWYGRNGDAKGFFPNKAVEEIVDQSSNDKAGNTLSSTAVTDNEKNTAVQSAGEAKIASEQSYETFKEIKETSPLEDKRRSRAKSTGRPPSQVFIKETILQRSESMENLSNASDEEDSEKQEVPNVSAKITSVSQLVMELKQKPNLKSGSQKEAAANNSSVVNTENAVNIPAWMKALPKKKVSVPEPIQKSENSDIVPPWMKEVRKRREHKLSLRSEDEPQPKVGQEFRTSQESSVKHSTVEIKSFSEKPATARLVTEEKQNIQKSFSLETREVSSNHTNFTTTGNLVSQRYSFTEDDVDKTETPVVENVKSSSKKTEASGGTETSNPVPQVKTVSNVVVTKIASSVQSKCINDAKDCSENIQPLEEAKGSITVSMNSNASVSKPKPKIECIKETHPEEPKLSVEKFAQFSETSINTDKKEENKKSVRFQEETASNSPHKSQHNKEKIAKSLQLLLNEIENLDKKHKARSLEIQKDIKKLEAAIDQQYEDIKIFTQAMKVKLSALMEGKED